MTKTVKIPEQTENQVSYLESIRRETGPVEILCKEIGFRFDRRMETMPVLVSFVRVLVAQVSHMRTMQDWMATFTDKEPTADSETAIQRIEAMLTISDRAAIIKDAAKVHALCDELNPEGKYPTDHLIDMVSSCASAIRFGLEKPCHSRHAASAAQHIWKHVYGVSLFDSFTPNWEKHWIRAQLQDAILSLVPTN